MNDPLVLKTIIFNKHYRPLKCNCGNPQRWHNDEQLDQDGIITIHDTTEPGVACPTAWKEEKCPGCGYYFWFTTGGKK